MTQDQQRKAIREMMRRHTQRVTVDAETALASLIEDGIYTPDGELAPEYGGKEKKTANAR